METKLPAQRNCSRIDINYQQFKVRLQLASGKIQDAVKTGSLPDLIDRIAKLCQVSILPAQSQRFMEIYEQSTSSFKHVHIRRSIEDLQRKKGSTTRSSLNLERKDSLQVLFRAVCDWFQLEKPSLLRVRPQRELSLQRQILLLYTFIQDYKLFVDIARSYSKDTAEYRQRIRQCTQKHIELYSKSKDSNAQQHTENFQKEICKILKHTIDFQRTDSNLTYKDGLDSVLLFYSLQFQTLNGKLSDNNLNENYSAFLVNFFQNKLFNSLGNCKENTQIDVYRKYLLHCYLEVTGYSSHEYVVPLLSEKQILDSLSRNLEVRINRVRLINLWKELSPHLSKIVNKHLITRKTICSARNSAEELWNFEYPIDKFDLLFDLILNRINSGIPRSKGYEFLKMHEIMRKYTNLKEKRISVQKNKELVKDFYLNLIHSIVCDYRSLSKELKTEFVLNRYQFLLSIINGAKADWPILRQDLLMNMHVIAQSELASDPQIQRKAIDIKNRILEDVYNNDKEVDLVTGITIQLLDIEPSDLANAMDLVSQKYPEIEDLETERSFALQSQAIEKIKSLFVVLDKNSEEYSESLLKTADTLYEYSVNLKNLDRSNEDIKYFLEMASSYKKVVSRFQGLKRNESELVAPVETTAYEFDTLKALKDIFKFYSMQKCEDAHKKPDYYMSVEQFNIFVRDFSIKYPADQLRHIYLSNSYSKTNLNEMQFFSVVEELSQQMYCAGDPKVNTRMFLRDIGCLDNSYKRKLVGRKKFSTQFKVHPTLLGNTNTDGIISPLKSLKSLKSPYSPKILSPRHKKILHRYRTSIFRNK